MKKSNSKHPPVLEVWLNQIRVGTITNLPYDRSLFIFDEDYVGDRKRPVLSLGFYDANGELISDLPLDAGMRQKIGEQLNYVPLTRQFIKSGGRKPSISARQKARRAAKRRHR